MLWLTFQLSNAANTAPMLPKMPPPKQPQPRFFFSSILMTPVQKQVASHGSTRAHMRFDAADFSSTGRAEKAIYQYESGQTARFRGIMIRDFDPTTSGIRYARNCNEA
jgi:hypothetical protein